MSARSAFLPKPQSLDAGRLAFQDTGPFKIRAEGFEFTRDVGDQKWKHQEIPQNRGASAELVGRRKVSRRGPRTRLTRRFKCACSSLKGGGRGVGAVCDRAELQTAPAPTLVPGSGLKYEASALASGIAFIGLARRTMA